mmetsp:Transcript_6051/g.11498  ORF Transcript_6051/g.11498 Transcript_6051/m.11498 type:complete len:998 (+) Transcript_6051:160-3153(+)|eukprot:CAMPEP_0182462736 /NCGR_PEP_ID=MMETSP1319-20130603/6894_1 /TAXON_ID=172717 /ORGANISM="Bolidomonas pacifica, Strain RCC208" /LENGTH=997 /DNA_ID=CAMNT_0024662193 /DNA_START=106 /DNA_END=3099 /DNA_ORIENTATION=+
MASNGTEMVSYTPAAQSEKLGDSPAPVKTVAPSDLEPITRIERISQGIARKITADICKTFCIMLGLLLLILFASFTVWGATQPGEYDWTVSSHKYSKDQDAVTSAFASVDPLVTFGANESRTTKSFIHSIFYIYEHEKSSTTTTLATAEHLQTMCEIEANLATLAEYPDYCALNPGTTQCSNMTLSFPLLFYGYGHDWSCPLLAQSDIDSTLDSMITSLSTEVGMLQYGFFFDKDVETAGYPVKLRSMVQLGSPLEGFSSETDRLTDQYRLYEKFFEKWETPMFKYIGVEHTTTKSAFNGDHVKDGLEVRYWGFDIQQLEFVRVVAFDMSFSMFSLLFVYIWIWVHTGSFFLASIGMLQIVASLPIGNLIYKVVFQIPYFDTLHTLVIFLVLGVGADDVFVLVDGWKQTAEIVERDEQNQSENEYLAKRMGIAYSRTAQAVFNTSFTTAMAFVATAISPIMPISTFGIYAALCIVINYIMVITFTPCAVLVWETRVSKWNIGPCQKCPCQASKKDVKDVDARDGVVEKFFDKLYIPTMAGNSKAFAVISILACVAWGIFSASLAFQLTPPLEQEKWFSDSHMFTGLLEDNSNLFLGGVDDQYVKMNFIYGVSGIDRDKNPSGEKFNMYIPSNNRGTVVFNDNFDITNADTQNDILTACTTIQNMVCNAKACSGGKLARPSGVTCFMSEFDTWLSSTYSETRSGLTGANLVARIKEFRADTKPQDDDIAGSWEETIGVVDGDIKYINIPTVSSMMTLRPVDEKQEVRDVVDDLLKQLDTGTASTGGVITEAGIAWTWMVTEYGLVNGLFTGFAICFPVAFLVLIMATKNVIVSFYAILAIIQIVASVMGIVQALDYDLGVAESIAGIIVIGFSVDYVVHLAHMYMEGLEEGKKTSIERFKYSCTHMGSTVVAGAITTGGSGSFMFACQLVFFFKMALLIVLTICFSLAYALLFFMPMLLLAGPDTTMGNISGFSKVQENFKERSGSMKARAKASTEPV